VYNNAKLVKNVERKSVESITRKILYEWNCYLLRDVTRMTICL